MSLCWGTEPEEARIACLRLPCFPLQWLYRCKPELAGRKVAWLPQLKPTAPLDYLSGSAQAAGLRVGMSYSAALGLVPDLFAGSCDRHALDRMECELLRELHRFSPRILRSGSSPARGLYFLHLDGLALAFRGLKNWALKLLKTLRHRRWQAALALGFTSFGCEVATYGLTRRQPWVHFLSRQQEQMGVMGMPLSALGLSSEGVSKLARFGIMELCQFLALSLEEVRRRFEPEVVELYLRASDALFSEGELLPEKQHLWSQEGLLYPTVDVEVIFRVLYRLLGRLLPQLIERGESVVRLDFCLKTEEGKKFWQKLTPSLPTADHRCLARLLRLRLEHSFKRYPFDLRQRIERVVLVVRGGPDPEKQEELFQGWEFVDEQRPSRDPKAALDVLARLRAEYGEGCLCRPCLLDHDLPGRNFLWEPRVEHESRFVAKRSVHDGLRARREQEGGEAASKRRDCRVRRWLSTPITRSDDSSQSEKEGSFLYEGGWWEPKPYARRDVFLVRERQAIWTYQDLQSSAWFTQGLLQ